MRIGFACGSPELIRYLNDAKYSFNSYTMDRTALAAGAAAVKDREYLKIPVIELLRQGNGQREN